MYTFINIYTQCICPVISMYIEGLDGQFSRSFVILGSSLLVWIGRIKDYGKRLFFFIPRNLFTERDPVLVFYMFYSDLVKKKYLLSCTCFMFWFVICVCMSHHSQTIFLCMFSVDFIGVTGYDLVKLVL